MFSVPYTFEGFEWDEGNLGHLDERHRFSPDEVEEVFFNSPVERSLGVVNGEKRYLAIGPTNSNRFLTVIFTMRDRKIRVVTAYASPENHKVLYCRERGY